MNKKEERKEEKRENYFDCDTLKDQIRKLRIMKEELEKEYADILIKNKNLEAENAQVS